MPPTPSNAKLIGLSPTVPAIPADCIVVVFQNDIATRRYDLWNDVIPADEIDRLNSTLFPDGNHGAANI